jgi:hypothetical protein
VMQTNSFEAHASGAASVSVSAVMCLPRSARLAEGDGNLAAHRTVRQRLREHRGIYSKRAESIEQGSIKQSLHRGPPSSWASCALAWCRFRRRPIADDMGRRPMSLGMTIATPRATSRITAFSTAGLLALGSQRPATFPVSQWCLGLQLADYSCGGSRGFGVPCLWEAKVP